jgi:hypothetical protein
MVLLGSAANRYALEKAGRAIDTIQLPARKRCFLIALDTERYTPEIIEIATFPLYSIKTIHYKRV